MCFYLSKSTKSKVAEEDIVCYKILVRNNISAVRFFHFLKGKINPKIELKVSVFEYDSVKSSRISRGYHSYKTIKIATHCVFAWDHIGKFIIPKGATYYSNRTEYVSDQIIFVERIKL